MADRGFKGLEHLQIYAMLDGNSKEIIEFNKQFMHYRSVVENVIAQLKKYKILKEELQLKVSDFEETKTKHHKISVVVSGILNRFVLPLRTK